MTRLYVDDLDFEVRLSDRRRTLQVTVERNSELVVIAPTGVKDDTLRKFVREKRYWIYKKLAEKQHAQRPIPRKEYVNGEGFLYLGRSYRLKLVDSQEEPLKLIGGRFCLKQKLVDEGRDHFVRWYSRRGKEWLTAKVAEYGSHMEVSPAGIKVQDLGYRWGSCGKGDWLYFHWKTMLLPRLIAEYVVVHELAHLYSPHHTQEFWRRVERTLADYERRKRWLAAHGMDVEGV